jgi:hypothetical protein
VQRLHVALPGDEPNITDDVGEQTTLLGGHFAEKAVPWKERKKFFGSPKGGYMLDPQCASILATSHTLGSCRTVPRPFRKCT